MSKAKNWDALGKVGKSAALTENKTEDKPAATTKAKHLKAVPTTYFEKHQELKAGGKTSLDFTAYIIEAIREKLERDGAL